LHDWNWGVLWHYIRYYGAGLPDQMLRFAITGKTRAVPTGVGRRSFQRHRELLREADVDSRLQWQRRAAGEVTRRTGQGF
jgi:hypothetical protein